MKSPIQVTLMFAALVLVLMIPACRTVPTEVAIDRSHADATVAHDACWGQATKVFAQMGVMGEHASDQEVPRVGLRNLARLLYEAGIIEDDSMESLGRFVAADLGLSIEACMD